VQRHRQNITDFDSLQAKSANEGMRSGGMGSTRNPYKTHTGIKKQDKKVIKSTQQDTTTERAYPLCHNGSGQ
jgi:phosphoribosylamine-glycine ligase